MTAILLVEDDAVSRRSVAQFFRLSGYEVCEAEESETAIRLLSHGDFEVVISDFNLPGELTGIDILDHARALRGSITRLLITGHGSDDLRKRAELLGAVYMEKPVQLEALEMIIEQRAKT